MNLKVRLIQFVNILQEYLNEFDLLYPETSHWIQISFLYFFALVDLLYAILTNIFSLGYIPETLNPIMPFINDILESPFFKVWSSPEKVFFLSYVVIELMVVRKTLKFSKIMKYNVLLIFALLMLQGLVLSYWDLLFHREITTAVSSSSGIDEGLLAGLNRLVAVILFFSTFIFFLFIYTYFYRKALKNEFATLKGLEFITDSVCFWLKIKTPTMRFGRRKKEENF